MMIHRSYSNLGKVQLWMVAVVALIALFGVSTASMANSQHEIIAICGACTSTQDFAEAATHAAPNPAPGDAQYRIFQVYVTNISQVEARYYDVAVWRDEGGINPMSGGFQSGVNKVATPGAGDPEMINALEDGAQLALAFHAEVSGGVTTDDFDSELPSAVVIVGPDDSQHGYNRLILANAINDHFNDRLTFLGAGLKDLVLRAAARFLGDSQSIVYMSNITVNFPDGSWVQVEVERILENFDSSSTIWFDVEVLEDTARLPNGYPVPQSAGQFSNFEWNDLSGGSNIAGVLRDLALIYGIDVGGAGDGLDCTFTCEPGTNNCTLSCQ